MSAKINKLHGLYAITDDILTPNEKIETMIHEALEGGAKIIQLRNKKDDDITVAKIASNLEKICKQYNAIFILNDRINVAINNKFQGLHIGKSDYDKFDEIRKKFSGIIGVSCYGNIDIAQEFEKKGADYVAFGSFYPSLTKPLSDVVNLEILKEAKNRLNIPICAIGGINMTNIDDILSNGADMVAIISDIWGKQNITNHCREISKKF